MDHAGVVVIGSGAAGTTAAATLRRGGYTGRIAVVRGEPGRPYNRTTVNKALLQGLVSVDAVALPDAEAPGVELGDVDPAAALDTSSRTVTLASGRVQGYDDLVIATGATPRPFPGAASPAARDRILTLRTAADTAWLRRWIADDVRVDGAGGVTILGAGLIGAEAAGVLTETGVPVRLVSSSATPMSAHVGDITAAYLATLHDRRVETHFGQSVTHARVDGDRLVATLTDGRRVSSDVLLVSIGVAPATSWLNGSGLDTSDGVAADRRLRARGATGVYVAGDLARITDADGHGRRVEHWNHAVAQGRHAALALLHGAGLGDDPGVFDHDPGYSTRIHGTRITIVGHPDRFVHETLVDGDPGDARFTVALTDDEHRLVGAVGVGDTRLANALRPGVHGQELLESALSVAGTR